MKMKYILIVNGYPKSGKTTFEQAIAKRYPSVIYSSITPVVEFADRMITECGDDYLKRFYNLEKERKSNRYRRLLSDVKHFLYQFDDGRYLNGFIKQKVADFLKNDQEKFLMIDIREPLYITKWVKWLSKHPQYGELFRIHTVFIKRNNQRIYGNLSDDGVEDYQYEYIVHNTASLDQFVGDTLDTFLESI